MLNYYLVKDGKAVVFDCSKHNHHGDEKSILVYADDPESAVTLAAKHNKGEIQPNYITCGLCSKSHRVIR